MGIQIGGATIIDQFHQMGKNQDDVYLERIEIELLIEGIYRYYGFDFRSYSFPFIQRRIWHRIHAEKLNSVSGLQEKVFHDPAVMKRIFADFSINVTEMFRDPSFFLAFRTKIIPQLRDYPLIRIWHAGCSIGKEVYSMAILLHEEGLFDKTKIYSTDMNSSVLEKAKGGVYPLDRMQTYTKNYLAAGGTRAFSEYYTVKQDQVVFHPFLRENVIFAQHNLATDQSFNEFHIIICRNVMIYFDKSLQSRVHQLFYESLSLSGFLGLGNREGIRYTRYADKYEDFDSAEKWYRRVK